MDFRNTVVILTSNLGFDSAKRESGLGFAQPSADVDYERLKAQMIEEFRKIFKPELLNRFDDIVVFRQLVKEDMEAILDIELARVRDRIKAKGKEMHFDKAAKEFLVDKGFDKSLGARPLRRAIERYIEDPLSEEILRGKMDEAAVIDVQLGDGALCFKAETNVKRGRKKSA